MYYPAEGHYLPIQEINMPKSSHKSICYRTCFFSDTVSTDPGFFNTNRPQHVLFGILRIY